MKSLGTISSLLGTGGLGLAGGKAGAVTEGLGVSLALEHSDIYSDGVGRVPRAAVWGMFTLGTSGLASSNEAVRSTDTPAETTQNAGLNLF